MKLSNFIQESVNMRDKKTIDKVIRDFLNAQDGSRYDNTDIKKEIDEMCNNYPVATKLLATAFENYGYENF